MSLLAKVKSGFFTLLGQGNIYPRVNLVPEGKPTKLGMVDDPEKKYDAANKNYVDLSVSGSVSVLEARAPEDTLIDTEFVILYNGQYYAMYGRPITFVP